MSTSRLGTYNGKYCGSETHKAKLTEFVIPVIRELRTAGISTRQLGRGLGVDHTAIWQATTQYPQLRTDGRIDYRYYTWNHVRGPQ